MSTFGSFKRIRFAPEFPPPEPGPFLGPLPSPLSGPNPMPFPFPTPPPVPSPFPPSAENGLLDFFVLVAVFVEFSAVFLFDLPLSFMSTASLVLLVTT